MDQHEEDTGQLLTEMLTGFGFTPDQSSRLIRWPQMSQEAFEQHYGKF
ncbi:hypothetical protein DFQ87_11540 [Salmonella enterica subsp. enterica serovar Montevideo]|nr:hypothetical protein [Salmonella enterica subsp. enterica serovar Montevideo]